MKKKNLDMIKLQTPSIWFSGRKVPQSEMNGKMGKNIDFMGFYFSTNILSLEAQLRSDKKKKKKSYPLPSQVSSKQQKIVTTFVTFICVSERKNELLKKDTFFLYSGQ